MFRVRCRASTSPPPSAAFSRTTVRQSPALRRAVAGEGGEFTPIREAVDTRVFRGEVAVLGLDRGGGP